MFIFYKIMFEKLWKRIQCKPKDSFHWLQFLDFLTFAIVWGIKLKKVDLSWPAVFSKSYNPSWIELNFLSSPWIELTQILHICPRLDLTQVEPTNSSQLRVDPKLKKINFFQVNSRKSWKNLNFFKNILDELISIIPKYLFWIIF